MPRVRIAFHSANPELLATFRRFAGGLNHQYESFFVEMGGGSGPAHFRHANFFFGSLAGSGREIAEGMKTLKVAHDHLRMVGNGNKVIPTGVVVDADGRAALSNLKQEALRLFVRIAPVVIPFEMGGTRTEVCGFSWTEDELDRVRTALNRAASPFNRAGGI